MLRQTFLFLSRQRNLRKWMETSSLAHRLTSRFVAGQGLSDVLKVSRKLEGQGICSTLDHLGENVTTETEARASRDAMLEALQEISAAGIRATISIKLTQFGLDISDAFCLSNVEPLVRRAHETGNRVEIDMESSEYTTRTLGLVTAMHERYGCVRSVLQAYLYRTEEDTRRLNALGLRVRLCKGAYDEPADIAFPKKEQVDENYLKLARMLLDEGTDPAMATHDEHIIRGILEYARKRGYGPGDFEFQMLYGVRRDLQEKLVKDGYRLRLYVPYGDAWYPYFMRRLAERPANVLFLAKNLLRA